ncbi:SDR family NAD(P)-dependent oxidoreductase [Pontibacillus litoralis]|uniref:Oxidoreductase n=1 Tax=Pontibacillus litoralis JSM 072002 TaxID=1385512 RepID=A0A0A5G4K3_9BACI|nr:SDR family oxidoreductase [Pontibacillus litoralis]KGX85995.1 oxidoreductase [Pontibacillus litoralis JSM 072002]
MQKRIAGKKVVITGASSGIGARIAWHVAEAGGVPILLARRREKLAEIANALTGESYVYACDIADVQAIQETFRIIIQEHGTIDALINNAGFGMFETVYDMDMKHFRAMFDVNVLGLIQCVKEVLPSMMERREGHIVHIASQAGKMATPKSAGYASTKHAVLGFTNALRMELKPHHVHVTAVNLGPVRTNFFDTADPQGTYQQSVERYMLDPDKVAERVVKHLFTSKREINMPGWMELGAKVYQLMPGVMEKVLGKQFARK